MFRNQTIDAYPARLLTVDGARHTNDARANIPPFRTAPLSFSLWDVHRQAFPSSIMTRLGKGVVDVFYSWLMQSNAMLAFIERRGTRGELVAFAILTRRPVIRDFMRENLARLTLLLFRNPVAACRMVGEITRKIGKVRAVSSSTPDPSIARLLVIAMDSRVHGTGMAQDIERECISRARASGFAGLGLSVHASNKRAIAFYEKQGWTKDMQDDVWTGQMSKIFS
jgi:ribosomal protein S18 acetylase RimI-like enzyme